MTQGEKTYVTGSLAASLSLNAGFAVLPPDVYFNSAFTITVWVYANKITKHSLVLDIAVGGANNNVLLGLSENDSLKPYFQIFKGTVMSHVVSTKALKQKAWSFLVASFDGSNSRIYINGVQTIKGVSVAPENVTRGSNFIGKGNWANNGPSYSYLDELRIYNRALSEYEISLLMYHF